MAVGYFSELSTNPFVSSDSKVSYVNPFDDNNDVLEVSSTQAPGSAPVPTEVSREARNGGSSCEVQDREVANTLRVERELSVSQRLTPGCGDTAVGHRNAISLDGATSCGRPEFYNGANEGGYYTEYFPSSNLRRVSAPSRNRDLEATANVGRFDDQRGQLLSGGSSRYGVEGEPPRDKNEVPENCATRLQEKPKGTSEVIANCLRVVEETKDAAGRTMLMLHCQGKQIHRTHTTAITLDRHLSVGEKILESLGGIFPMKWKPKIARIISGPVECDEDSKFLESRTDRATLGLGNYSPEASDEDRQSEADDKALSDLSNVIGQLKDMSLLMKSEISKQTEDLTNLENNVEELNSRVKGANVRGRKLLR